MSQGEGGGRPLKFETVEELKQKIDEYFAECDPHMVEVTEWVEARDSKGQLKKNEMGMNYLVEVTHKKMTKPIPYTITGLAVHLKTSRQTLVNYETKEKYFDTIKEAKEKCEHWVEENMLSGAANPTGSIFSLKNNYNWQDKTVQEHEGDIFSGGTLNIRVINGNDRSGSERETVSGEDAS